MFQSYQDHVYVVVVVDETFCFSDLVSSVSETGKHHHWWLISLDVVDWVNQILIFSACQPYQEAPEASTLSCNSTACTATCLSKYKFPKGESTLNVECVNRKWVIKNPKYKDVKELPGCSRKFLSFTFLAHIIVFYLSAVCSPACLNKGKCIAPNHCQCTQDFQGKNCREKACRSPPAMTRNSKRTCKPKWVFLQIIICYFPRKVFSLEAVAQSLACQVTSLKI